MSRTPVENEDVCGTPGQGRTLEEPLHVRNLIQESEYLYEDVATLHQKHKAQVEDLSHQLQLSQLKNEKLENEMKKDKEVIDCLSQENAELKIKLSEKEHTDLMYNEATKRLSHQGAELDLFRDVVTKHQNEARQFKEQAEILTEQNQILQDRTLEAQELAVKTRKELEEAQNKLDTMSALYDLQLSALRQERAHRHKFERMTQILLYRSSDTDEEELQDGRFRLVQNSTLVECTKCRVHCDLVHLKDMTCRFHPSKPVHPLTWKILLPDRQDSVPSDHFYWPCCDVFSRVEPEGCHQEPRHAFDH